MYYDFLKLIIQCKSLVTRVKKYEEALSGTNSGYINGNPIPWDPRWPNAQYPYASPANACSTPIVKVNQVLGADFTAACNGHDLCYRTLGKTKGECDDQFWKYLVDAVKKSNTSGWISAAKWTFAPFVAGHELAIEMSAATLYYSAVCLAPEAQVAYDNNQRESREYHAYAEQFRDYDKKVQADKDESFAIAESIVDRLHVYRQDFVVELRPQYEELKRFLERGVDRPRFSVVSIKTLKEGLGKYMNPDFFTHPYRTNLPLLPFLRAEKKEGLVAYENYSGTIASCINVLLHVDELYDIVLSCEWLKRPVGDIAEAVKAIRSAVEDHALDVSHIQLYLRFWPAMMLDLTIPMPQPNVISGDTFSEEIVTQWQDMYTNALHNIDGAAEKALAVALEHEC